MLLGHKVMVKMAFRDRRSKRWIYRDRVASCKWNGMRGRLEWRHRHCYWQGKVKYHDDDTMTMSKETTHMYKGDLEKYPEDHYQRSGGKYVDWHIDICDLNIQSKRYWKRPSLQEVRREQERIRCEAGSKPNPWSHEPGQGKGLPVGRYNRRCWKCKADKPRRDYDELQWARETRRRCRECLTEACLKACSECHEKKPEADYANNEWQRKRRRKCRACEQKTPRRSLNRPMHPILVQLFEQVAEEV